jgi:hypothetical protein
MRSILWAGFYLKQLSQANSIAYWIHIIASVLWSILAFVAIAADLWRGGGIRDSRTAVD